MCMSVPKSGCKKTCSQLYLNDNSVQITEGGKDCTVLSDWDSGCGFFVRPFNLIITWNFETRDFWDGHFELCW